MILNRRTALLGALSACACGPEPSAPAGGVELSRGLRPAYVTARGAVATRFGPVAFSLLKGAAAAPPLVVMFGDDADGDLTVMQTKWERRVHRSLPARPAPVIVLSRPYAVAPERWRQPAEWRMADEALRILGARYGFSRYDVLGHSGGAHLAVTLAQETGRVRHVIAASPPLAVKAWQRGGAGAITGVVARQYDPLDHISRLTAQSVVIVADPADTVVPPKAWRSYLDKARRLGAPVTYQRATGRGENRHGTSTAAFRAYRGLIGDA